MLQETMNVLINEWCVSWKRRGSLFKKGYSKFNLIIILISVVFINLTVGKEGHGGGNPGISSNKYHFQYDHDNGDSDLVHYYGDELIIQFDDARAESVLDVNSNALFRNVTNEEGKLKGDTSKSESGHVLDTQSIYGGSEATSLWKPILNPSHPDANFENPEEVVNGVGGLANPPVDPHLDNNFFSHHFDEQQNDLLEPLLHHSNADLEHHGHGYGALKEVEHINGYLPIISIAAVYLILSVLVFSAAILSEKHGDCAPFGKETDGPPTNWLFHARRRVIPARSIDPHLQQRFLELFRGMDENEDHSSSEEFSDIDEDHFIGDLDRINTLCPKHAFFFSLSPRHIEAYSTLKTIFLAQSSPEEVISLAKYLLVNKKVHPKVWYIAIVGAKLDRPDMAGFSVAHPLDAIPDWYLPGDLITDKLEKYREGRSQTRVKRYTVIRSRYRNSTFTMSKKGKGNTSIGVAFPENKGGNKSSPSQEPTRNLEFDDKHGRHHHHHHKHHYKKKKKKGGKKKKQKKCITVDWRVGVDNGIENELWYFREDIMMNQHHWYWHQVYPPNSTMHGDRRAELFFAMHRAFIARYNAERLSNGMVRVSPLDMRPGGIIPDGYNSHLADVNSGQYWTPRGPQTPLQDVFHDDDPDLGRSITFRDYSRNNRRLAKAAKLGRLFSESGHFVPINHARGIEHLANTVDASDLSVNPLFYDPAGIHTLGHILVGMSADPSYQFQRVTGIMSDGALSMRDSSFYAYHSFLDNLFELHKQTLPPYRPFGGDFPLHWKGVEVVGIELESEGGLPSNELRTFWTHRKFGLSPGVDGSIEKGNHDKVCAQHLDHEPFRFKIVIDRKPCVISRSGKATVRIFMAPRYDEKGRRIPVKIQRRLMFPLDSFPVKLKVGRNTIIRHAEDSALTQPWTKSLKELEKGPDPSGSAEYCGCGWPQHLYIPKGKPDGMAFDLFVMVTNYDEDYVPNETSLLEIPETCNSPFIFCGLPRRRYPDKRPMGYPFDRPLSKSLHCPPGWTFFSVFCRTINSLVHKPIDSLEQYVFGVPNMAMLKFHIRHLDTFRPEPPRH